MATKNLINAKKEKNDEFYTLLTDIEKEIIHYKEQLQNKIIFCNCDDPEESNFWKYFKLNFKHLGLKKLISTHFSCTGKSYKLEYNGIEIIKTELSQNGDFRSPECIEILKESDIVITNPPFSLFREYISLIIAHNKKFLVIGNQNAIGYKEISPLIQDNKMWLGYINGEFKFKVPQSYISNNIEHDIDGNKYVKLGNITWYTNLNTSKRRDKLVLHKKYNPVDYPTYDNYDAIHIKKIADIPCDYDGAMGVPTSILCVYNPDQFKIIGFRVGNDGKDLRINGICPYFRMLIKKIE